MQIVKNIIIASILFIINFNYAQEQESWRMYYNQDSTLIGYKDHLDKIMIPPKFMGYTHAHKLDHIIAVTEPEDKGYINYYITKEKKVVGRDSLYTLDNTADCEREGFIRFRDPITDLVGLFNQKGEITIPASYSMLQPVTNNVVIGLYGASKKYKDDKHQRGCNHYSWEGGNVYLLDTKGNILVENFEYEYETNLFSLQITNQKPLDSLRKSYVGKNKKYYSVINYEEEFTQWIEKHLYIDLTLEKLKTISYPKITHWVPETKWKQTPASEFLTTNFKHIKQLLQLTKEKKVDYFITMDGLNPFMYETTEYDQYFDNCRQARRKQYPVLALYINQMFGEESDQKSLHFLRTDKGYKLIQVSIN
ncbi:hypothetical protein GCM10022393_05210 [Aquimarina addita]|uniref:WG repeat-containing protein n=1 Tax=Aquimarina addita TaxID=870485 RepID=A0ABP7XA50_9FLAO